MNLDARGVQRDRFDLDAYDLRLLQLLEHPVEHARLRPAVHARVDRVPLAEALGQVAHDLHAHEPLDEVWRARPDVRGVAEGAGRTHQDRSGLVGLHEHQGSSRRHGRSKKNGPQAIGKSRGGWNTKVHMVAADARTAITFSLSPGQAHDAPEGRALLSRLGPPSRGRCTSSWIAPTRATRHGSLRWTWVSSPSCHP